MHGAAWPVMGHCCRPRGSDAVVNLNFRPIRGSLQRIQRWREEFPPSVAPVRLVALPCDSPRQAAVSRAQCNPVEHNTAQRYTIHLTHLYLSACPQHRGAPKKARARTLL